jgi:hypothetical protein
MPELFLNVHEFLLSMSDFFFSDAGVRPSVLGFLLRVPGVFFIESGF